MERSVTCFNFGWIVMGKCLNGGYSPKRCESEAISAHSRHPSAHVAPHLFPSTQSSLKAARLVRGLDLSKVPLYSSMKVSLLAVLGFRLNVIAEVGMGWLKVKARAWK